MSTEQQPMTAEDRAHLDRLINFKSGRSLDFRHDQLVIGLTRALAEIDRLNRVVDQAIGVSDMIIFDRHICMTTKYHDAWGHTVPDLAAELERRKA